MRGLITRDSHPEAVEAILDMVPEAHTVEAKRCPTCRHRYEGAYRIQGRLVTILGATKNRDVEPWEKIPLRIYIDQRPPADAPRGCKCGPIDTPEATRLPPASDMP